MNIKEGSILRSKDKKDARIVLAVCGDVYCLSTANSPDVCDRWYTLKEIEENYIVPKEEWRIEKVLIPSLQGNRKICYTGRYAFANYPLAPWRRAKLWKCYEE